MGNDRLGVTLLQCTTCEKWIPSDERSLMGECRECENTDNVQLNHAVVMHENGYKTEITLERLLNIPQGKPPGHLRLTAVTIKIVSQHIVTDPIVTRYCERVEATLAFMNALDLSWGFEEPVEDELEAALCEEVSTEESAWEDRFK